MLHAQKFMRPASLVLAALVAALSCTCIQRAMATTTVANAYLIPYNLAAGAFSGLIGVQADRPNFVVGTNTTPGDRGTGNMSLERAAGAFLEWAGLNSDTAGGLPTITGGFSGATGTKMLQIDFTNPGTGNGVFLEVNNPDAMVIHNKTGIAQTGVVLIVF